jgi:hypothetical protein
LYRKTAVHFLCRETSTAEQAQKVTKKIIQPSVFNVYTVMGIKKALINWATYLAAQVILISLCKDCNSFWNGNAFIEIF